MTPAQQEALNSIAAAAVQAERDSGSPGELAAAQAILESAWLTHAPGNNCFGIKEYAGCPGRQLMTTHEFFTPQNLAAFLGLGDGRTAELDPPQQPSGFRQRYRVQDWFAAYADLAAGFAYHGILLQRGLYQSAWEQYQRDRNLDGYIDGIARHYATDPNYAASVKQLAHAPYVAAALAAVRTRPAAGAGGPTT